MEPLIALLSVTGGLAALSVAGIVRLRPWTVPVRYGLATMFAMTGVAHFVGMRDELVEMVPPLLPAPGVLVTITGVLELAGAAGLVYRRTSLAAATGLSLLMIAMFPANVHAAREQLSDAFADQLVPRTVMEVVFLAASTSLVVDGIRRRLARPGRRLVSAR
jgi:uncharacterized membrane protein